MKLSKSHLLGLRVFSVVARLESVTLAARELNVTAGAVSQQLNQLESLLGTRLFHRTAGRLYLTDQGRTLFVQCEASFHQLGRAVAEVARPVASHSLRVKLGPTQAIHWLLPRLPLFYSRHPDIQLEISTYLSAQDATLDQADLVIRVGAGHWDDGDCDLIFKDVSVPICTPEVAKRLRKPADILRENLLHSMIRPELWSLWLAAYGLDTAAAATGTRFAMAELAYQAALKGLGVAIAQTLYVKSGLAAAGLVTPLGPVDTGGGYYLVYEKHRAKEHAVKAFRDWTASMADDATA